MGTMSFTRIEKRGDKEYAYEITSYWDKKSKNSKHQKRYLGIVVDKKKKIYERKLMSCNSEKLMYAEKAVTFCFGFLNL